MPQLWALPKAEGADFSLGKEEGALYSGVACLRGSLQWLHLPPFFMDGRKRSWLMEDSRQGGMGGNGREWHTIASLQREGDLSDSS